MENQIKKKLPIFFHGEMKDRCLVFALIIMFLIFCNDFDQGDLSMRILPVAFMFVFVVTQLMCSGFARYIYQDKGYQRLKFNGCMDELTVRLKNMGLDLSKKVGNNYVFKTSYRIMPNLEYLTTDHGEYCSILLTRFEVESIRVQLMNEQCFRGNK